FRPVVEDARRRHRRRLTASGSRLRRSRRALLARSDLRLVAAPAAAPLPACARRILGVRAKSEREREREEDNDDDGSRTHEPHSTSAPRSSLSAPLDGYGQPAQAVVYTARARETVTATSIHPEC